MGLERICFLYHLCGFSSPRRSTLPHVRMPDEGGAVTVIPARLSYFRKTTKPMSRPGIQRRKREGFYTSLPLTEFHQRISPCDVISFATPLIGLRTTEQIRSVNFSDLWKKGLNRSRLNFYGRIELAASNIGTSYRLRLWDSRK